MGNSKDVEVSMHELEIKAAKFLIIQHKTYCKTKQDNSQDSMLLAKEQTLRSTEQKRELRSRLAQIYSTDSDKGVKAIQCRKKSFQQIVWELLDKITLDP